LTDSQRARFVRIANEGDGGIVLAHPAVQVRFDPETGAAPGDVVVHTGSGRLAPDVPMVNSGASLRALSYAVPPGPWGRQARSAVTVLLTLPDGLRFGHLGLALTGDVPQQWMETAVSQLRGADWLVVGVPDSDVDGFIDRLQQFEAGQFLMVDLHVARWRHRFERHARIAPIVDRARAAGVAATSMAPKVSVRFELQ
jgi:hypothetical protein